MATHVLQAPSAQAVDVTQLWAGSASAGRLPWSSMSWQQRDPTDTLTLFIQEDKTGSSSIRLWDTLESDMAPLRVLNRGFGGAHMSSQRLSSNVRTLLEHLF